VINPPVVRVWEEKKRKKKEWKYTFVSPPDLGSQERDEWVQAVTENRNRIAVLNRLKLNNGDMCTVLGIRIGERVEPMTKGKKQQHITIVKVTEVIPGIRETSRKANVLQPKGRQWKSNCRKSGSFKVKASKAQTMWGIMRFLLLLSP
jgi:hypothetical protein